jgi:ketosteroid isomerase-like protein
MVSSSFDVDKGAGMGEISRADGVRNAFIAGTGDLDALIEQLTDDVVWHVGGDHPLSGDYRGKEAVRAYLDRVAELTGGSLKLEPLDVLASDRYVGVFHRVQAEVSGQRLDTTMVQARRRAEDGRYSEYWALATDQPAVDEFWKALTR